MVVDNMKSDIFLEMLHSQCLLGHRRVRSTVCRKERGEFQMSVFFHHLHSLKARAICADSLQILRTKEIYFGMIRKDIWPTEEILNPSSTLVSDSFPMALKSRRMQER